MTIAAGAYEFTPLKRHHRRRCREDVRSGLQFGLYCVGSSIGLMVMLVALGVMSSPVPALRLADPTYSNVLEAISDGLPMTYAFDGLERATTGETGGRLVIDAAVVLGSVLIALMLGATTLRRRTP